MGVIPDVKTQDLLVGTIRHAWLVVREECGVVRLTAMLPAQLVTQAAILRKKLQLCRTVPVSSQ